MDHYKVMNAFEERILRIVVKELNNELLEKNDCEALEEFTKIYEVERASEKEFINILDTGARVVESIDGVKLIAVIKSFDDNKVIILGPIFNYQEHR